MLELIRSDTAVDFVGKRAWAFAFSGALTTVSLAALVLIGPRWGIDFTGGLFMHVRTDGTVDARTIRSAFADGPAGVTVQDAGPNEYLLRFSGPLPSLERDVRPRLEQALPGHYEILRVELVGPRVGADLRRQALLAVVAATVMMGVYVAWRFELRFGLGAAAALVHDVIVTVGALTLFGYEIDLPMVAALLTVVGFSVNDTVIVSDRIRENRRKHPRLGPAGLVNRSINETLSRTVLTTGTALLVLLPLFLLGGSVIHGFAFALLVGLSIGTYSSIFVAIPIVLALRRRAR